MLSSISSSVHDTTYTLIDCFHTLIVQVLLFADQLLQFCASFGRARSQLLCWPVLGLVWCQVYKSSVMSVEHKFVLYISHPYMPLCLTTGDN